MSKIKKNLPLIAIILIALGIYKPALSNFFTHDDFFHFRISQANSFKDFLQFFSLTKAPSGWGFYRPLTTQVFYYVGDNFFNSNPFLMHLVGFSLFIITILLVYKLISHLIKNPTISYLATFFYAVSATHFPHLYFIANQELGHAVFFLTSLLFFIKFLKHPKLKTYLVSFLAFIAALMSKELAILLPGSLLLIYWLKKSTKETSFSLKKILLVLLPFFITLTFYGYFHVFHYGLIQGDSYIWVFSPDTLLNTLFWYTLWSLNMPKMLLDFVGPGFHINPNLFAFWPKEIYSIFTLFILLITSLLTLTIISFKQLIKSKTTYLIALGWFIYSLLPVMFLPWHKFPDYLTLPLIGIVVILAKLLYQATQVLIKNNHHFFAKLIFILIPVLYLALSLSTLNLVRKIDWITQGAKTSQRVFNYFNNNFSQLEKNIDVFFYDTPEDADLPWKPSDQLKIILSDNNFFSFFYHNKITAHYVSSEDATTDPKAIKIPARKFLGY